MSNHYSIIPHEDSGYTFTTDGDCIYLCTFQKAKYNYGLPSKFQVFYFEFYPYPQKKIEPKEIDIKIQATIVKIFKDFFNDYPMSVLCYICEDTDLKAYKRSNHFRRWFERNYKNSDTIYYKVDIGKDYKSAFIFKNNPELKGAIETIINIEKIALTIEKKPCNFEIIG